MYFPYVRGRQFELLALREMVTNNLLSQHIIPIVEPVKLSPTLVSVMEEFIKCGRSLAVIRNPMVGTFLSDWEDADEQSREAGYKKRFIESYNNSVIVKSLMMQKNTKLLLKAWERYGYDRSEFLVVSLDRDYLPLYESEFTTLPPHYALIPDERAFTRRVHDNRVLLDDKFEKQDRNADYQDNDDEFFSEDHLYYREDGFIGFSDYSVIGNEYLEAGFAPYAVAIHIVYFAADKTLRIKHFVSDSNDDISNPALKFYEAVTKLKQWCTQNSELVEMTSGLQTFLQHYEQQSYPGLGTVKKLSLMHHIELIGKYLDRCSVK